jgi:hypothetical protein
MLENSVKSPFGGEEVLVLVLHVRPKGDLQYRPWVENFMVKK